MVNFPRPLQDESLEVKVPTTKFVESKPVKKVEMDKYASIKV